MSQAGRLAGQMWDGYKNNLLMQDIVETAIATLGIAGAQALFSDMSMEEIAAAAAVGVGAGMAGRPLGDRLGRMGGRYADKAFPQSSASFKQNVEESIAMAKEMGGEVGTELLDAKLKHHLPEGRGIFEGMGSIYGRAYGDNLAQAAVGLAAPVFLGSGAEDEVPVAA